MKADKIYTNGEIYTVNNDLWVDSVAIYNDKIIYIGNESDINNFVGTETFEVNLKGKMMLPGFIDGHNHFLLASYFNKCIELTDCKSINDIDILLSDYINLHQNNVSYVGFNLLDSLFHTKELNKNFLDKICSDKPLILIGRTLHVCCCNSLALENLISKHEKEDFNKEYFYKDKSENLTGVIKEWEFIGNVFLDNDFCSNMDEIEESIYQVSNFYASKGITSLSDAGIFNFMFPYFKENMENIVRNNKFKQRYNFGAFYASSTKEFKKKLKYMVEFKNKYLDNKFNATFFKLFNDGVNENSNNACSASKVVHDPFFSYNELSEIFLQLAKNNLDIQIHCIGDNAILNVIKATKNLREKGFNNTHVICVHNYMVKKEFIPLYSKYNIIINTSPLWMGEHYPQYAPILNKNNILILPLKSIVDNETIVGFGSDFPVDFSEEVIDILLAFNVGQTRKFGGKVDAPTAWPETEVLNLKTLIKGYTYNNAYQMHMENKIGSIEVGKFADFVILEKNLFDVDVFELPNVKILETILGGKTTYTSRK